MHVIIPSDCTQEQLMIRINEVGINNITSLGVSSSLNITFIPPMENLEILYILRCPNITRIDVFPNLRELTCVRTSIEIIPRMEKLVKICCMSSKNMKKILYFPNLEELICSGSSITSIAYMEKLKKLECAACLNLKKISHLFNLEVLDCSQNKINFFIPLNENLKELKCTKCPNLHELYCNDKLEKIKCDEELKIKRSSKNLVEVETEFGKNNDKILQGKLYQNMYCMYELLI